MTKRKKSKSADKPSMSVELIGLIIALLGIIGFGFGYAGTLVKEFAMFLMGSWWILFILFLIYIGLYMLFQRRMPKFFSSKMIGFYLVVIVILTASHFGFLDKSHNVSGILKNTIDQFMERIKTIDASNSILDSGNTNTAIGGGFLGAIFISGLNFLFDRTGTIIVLSVLGLFGAVMFSNITLSSITGKIKTFVRKNKDEESIEVKETTSLADISEEIGLSNEDEVVEQEKIIVSTLEELKARNIKDNKAVEVEEKEYEEMEPMGEYQLPSINILSKLSSKSSSKTLNKENIEKTIHNIVEVFQEFQIGKSACVAFHVGPAFTQYEMKVPAGTKVSRILSINKEIALKLAAKDVRIEAPIPGKSTIGIEVPNESISSVPFKEVLEANISKKDKYNIMITLGKNLMGEEIVADLTKTPHLLVAGSTGSGKSVCINSIICSVLMNYKPDEVQLVLVDPKKVEFTVYEKIRHLRYPVINDPKAASGILQKIVAEMDRRYTEFANTRVRKIEEYNEKIAKKDPDKKMPYIVVIIDELADLMLVASKEVESSIMRITQLARAAGIHLIVATQRPSTNVITGVIKANIPSRICFAVASSIDSRTALDMTGAEKLLGKGDMLYLPMGENNPERIQGCFISDDDIDRLVAFWSKQGKQNFVEDLKAASDIADNGDGIDGYDDPMYDEIVQFAVETGKISASLIQRRFRFGFNRAARMIDLLESRGIVGPQNGSKPREVLVKIENEEE